MKKMGKRHERESIVLYLRRVYLQFTHEMQLNLQNKKKTTISPKI